MDPAACAGAALAAERPGAAPGVSAGWLDTVTREIARSEYRFSLQPDGSYAAPNRS